jgi:hypothetical protein
VGVIAARPGGGSHRCLPTHLSKVLDGEDDADIADEVVQQAKPLLVARAFGIQANAAADHGVLAHQDGAVRAEGLQQVVGEIVKGVPRYSGMLHHNPNRP